MFRGLRIRMGCHTGVVTRHRYDVATNTHAYQGPLMEVARATSEAASGGQILVTRPTVAALQSTAHLSSARYGDVALLHEGRHFLTPPPPDEAQQMGSHFRRALAQSEASASAQVPHQRPNPLQADSGSLVELQSRSSASNLLPSAGLQDVGFGLRAEAPPMRTTGSTSHSSSSWPRWRAFSARLPSRTFSNARRGGAVGEAVDPPAVTSLDFELSLRRPDLALPRAQPGTLVGDISTEGATAAVPALAAGEPMAASQPAFLASPGLQAGVPTSLNSVHSDGDRPSPLPQFAFPRLPSMSRHPSGRLQALDSPASGRVEMVPGDADSRLGGTFESVAGGSGGTAGHHQPFREPGSPGTITRSASPRLASGPVLSPTPFALPLSAGSSLVRAASQEVGAEKRWSRGWRFFRGRAGALHSPRPSAAAAAPVRTQRLRLISVARLCGGTRVAAHACVQLSL